MSSSPQIRTNRYYYFFRALARPSRFYSPPPTPSRRKEVEMLERLIDIEVTGHGTIIEELEVVCCMTGFRQRLLVEYLGDGTCRFVELGPG